MSSDWDLIVIGGGAAGFFAAITTAETRPGTRILILEKTAKLLGKVKISGGGRCNVTHDCPDPRRFSQHYPRGHKQLIGPLNRWSSLDTINWFQNHGVQLKTEADGRMFPVTDNSQTVIDCLTNAARNGNVQIQTSTTVTSITPESNKFILTTSNQQTLTSKNILLATGGTRLAAGAKLAQSLGHNLVPDIPSLFAFNITHPLLQDLPGISVSNVHIQIEDTPLQSQGPLLITHQGLSGPAILKLSAWGARQLHSLNYHFNIHINWTPEENPEQTLRETRNTWGKRLIHSRPPFANLPKRLWKKLCTSSQIPENLTWAQLNKSHTENLTRQLTQTTLPVTGKSTNKDEFVTAGGIDLKELNLTTMQSKIQPNLYFAGEVLDIDGITGGFNFQNAWTTAHLAGTAIAFECGST